MLKIAAAVLVVSTLGLVTDANTGAMPGTAQSASAEAVSIRGGTFVFEEGEGQLDIS